MNIDKIAADIEMRLAGVSRQIERAAERSGRPAGDITIVAVTKTWPLTTLQAAVAAGLYHFGENRTHELAEKRPALENLLGPTAGVRWHFIGHLQTRQSQAVADYADLFHAADRLKIIHRLGRQLAENGRQLPILLEVNISGEASKSGFEAGEWEQKIEQKRPLLETLAAVEEMPELTCEGLMTMAPWDADPDFIRAVFRRTRLLRDELEQLTGRPLPFLSMGMTDDFELAIEEGATHVRIGRALFGERI